MLDLSEAGPRRGRRGLCHAGSVNSILGNGISAVTMVPPVLGLRTSQLPPSAAIRWRIDASPWDVLVWSRFGGMPLPSSETRRTKVSPSMPTAKSADLASACLRMFRQGFLGDTENTDGGIGIECGLGLGIVSVHLSPARRQVSLNCQRSAANKPMLSSKVGLSSSTTRRFKSTPALKDSWMRLKRCSMDGSLVGSRC